MNVNMIKLTPALKTLMLKHSSVDFLEESSPQNLIHSMIEGFNIPTHKSDLATTNLFKLYSDLVKPYWVKVGI